MRAPCLKARAGVHDWQILDGINHIPITLFEAVADLDSGPIYLNKQIELKGHELVNEWRSMQAKASMELCLDWLIVTRRWWLEQGLKMAALATTSDEDLPILSWILTAPWLINLTCYVW